jgi:hypothetical protein
MDKGSATIGGGKVWDPLTGRKDASHARKELLHGHGACSFQALRSTTGAFFLSANVLF